MEYISVKSMVVRHFPGCVHMDWKNRVLLPAVGSKQNVTFLPTFTQPGRALLVQPCRLFTTEQEQIEESCQINDLPWTIDHAYEGCGVLRGLVFLWQDGSGNEAVSQKTSMKVSGRM